MRCSTGANSSTSREELFVSSQRDLIDAPGARSAIGPCNEAYGSFFVGSPPARAAIGVASLPKGVKVEIEAIVAAL
jgi:enamine deaminase RidA (YjgF/YER057c/UK114 family)